MGKAFRPGLSCCCDQDLTEQVFENYSNSGFNTMELSFNYDRYAGIDWENIYKRAKNSGIELWSFHLPFQPFETVDIACKDKQIRQNTLKYQSELIKRACNIGAQVMVIHPSAEPNSDSERKEKIKYAKESLAYLADVAASGGATIAVENLPRTCLGRDSQEILELISADERLRVCFDTNHLLSQPIKEFIEAVGDKIITTHFSDFDFKNERHWLPGEGKTDWPELINTLKNVGYSGPLMYELGFEAPKSITRRRLTYDDFRKNYESLMEGKIPEAIGVPVESECTRW